MIESPSYLATPDDPWKDPARRWLRAGYLVRHNLIPFWTQDDGDVCTAWRYQRELAGNPVDDDGVIFVRSFNTIAEAHHYYSMAPLMTRAELEARLLAGQSDAVIAAKMNMSPAGVAVYHAVFFEVRPHLQADAYIVNVVLGGKVHSGIDRDDHPLLLKVIAYGMGGAGVDRYIDFLNDPPVMPASVDLMDLSLLKELRDKTEFKVGLLVMTTPAAAASPTSWLWLRERLAAQRRGAVESVRSLALAIRPALEAPAFAVPAQTDRVADDRRNRQDDHQFVTRRRVRSIPTPKQRRPVAVPA